VFAVVHRRTVAIGCFDPSAMLGAFDGTVSRNAPPDGQM
jgi:hypothetical protein